MILLLALNTNIPLLAILFSVSMIVISFTIWMFSYFFADEYQIKIKSLYAKIAMLEGHAIALQKFCNVKANPKDSILHTFQDIKTEEYPPTVEINYRTGKPYKVSVEKRKNYLEKKHLSVNKIREYRRHQKQVRKENL
jgi:hypothetical protein